MSVLTMQEFAKLEMSEDQYVTIHRYKISENKFFIKFDTKYICKLCHCSLFYSTKFDMYSTNSSILSGTGSHFNECKQYKKLLTEKYSLYQKSISPYIALLDKLELLKFGNQITENCQQNSNFDFPDNFEFPSHEEDLSHPSQERKE